MRNSPKGAEVKTRVGRWSDQTTHLPENTGDKRFELILVEFKARPTAAK